MVNLALRRSDAKLMNNNVSVEKNIKKRVRSSYIPFRLTSDKRTVSASVIEAEIIERLNGLKQDYIKAFGQLEKKKDSHPGKHLRCCKHRNSYQYYIWEPSKSDKARFCNIKSPTIQALAQRDYENDLKKDLLRRINDLDKILKIIDKNGLANTYESKSEGLQRYIHPAFLSTKKFAEIWSQEAYDRKEINSEIQCHITENGEYVRSKSEVFIANTLKRLGIPYRYECPLEVNGIIIHPDFTLINPKTGKIYYWEHLGMMDDRQYVSDALKRIQNYEAAGIAIGKDLILTGETIMNPLNAKRIEMAIKLYIK